MLHELSEAERRLVVDALREAAHGWWGETSRRAIELAARLDPGLSLRHGGIVRCMTPGCPADTCDPSGLCDGCRPIE